MTFWELIQEAAANPEGADPFEVMFNAMRKAQREREWDALEWHFNKPELRNPPTNPATYAALGIDLTN